MKIPFAVVTLITMGLHPAASLARKPDLDVGMYPLTKAHYAVWVYRELGESEKTVDFVLYAVGPAGWHGQTAYSLPKGLSISQTPVTITIPGNSGQIVIAYDPPTRMVTADGMEASVEENNVFVLSGIGEKETALEGVGKVDLVFDVDENPSETLLHRHSKLRRALAGEPPEEFVPRPEYSEAARELDELGSRLIAEDTDTNYEKAVEALRVAAEAGVPRAQYNLGYCYQVGEGVIKDEAVANNWYMKAALQGHVDAQFKLGYSFEVGRGTEIDDKESYRWYHQAALNGDVVSQYRVAVRLRDGVGVQRDPVLSYSWFLVVLEESSRFQSAEREVVESEAKALKSTLSAEEQKVSAELYRGRLESLARMYVHRLAY